MDTLVYLSLAEGTSFAPSYEALVLLASLLLDGMRWMTVGSPAVWDWSVKGYILTTLSETNICRLSHPHFLFCGTVSPPICVLPYNYRKLLGMVFVLIQWCFNGSMLQCFNASMLQCFNASMVGSQARHGHTSSDRQVQHLPLQRRLVSRHPCACRRVRHVCQRH